MTITSNGTTEKDTGGNGYSVDSHSAQGLGSLERESGVDGFDKNRVDNASSSRQNLIRKTQRPEDSTGKALERLKFIETEYLLYVKGDQERLEARLVESREREENFKKVVRELEQEIYNLVSNQEEEHEDKPS